LKEKGFQLGNLGGNMKMVMRNGEGVKEEKDRENFS
jgi:hypothetical protein